MTISPEFPATLLPRRFDEEVHAAPLTRAAQLGTDFVEGWRAGIRASADLPPVARVLIMGMGGSGMAGEYIRDLARISSPIPVEVLHSPWLPAWNACDTLTIICSHSGNTAEAIQAFCQAREAGGPLAVINGGGELGRLAQADPDCVEVRLQHPGPPRAALGEMLGALAGLLKTTCRLRLSDETVRCAALLHAEAFELATGLAAVLEGPLSSATPLFVGSEHLEPVAHRAAKQLAENGKGLALAGTLPEMAHNLVVGLQQPAGGRDQWFVVCLESAEYLPATHSAYNALDRLCDMNGIACERFKMTPSSPIADVLQATALVDRISLLRAELLGIDPDPIREIDLFKSFV